MSSPIGIFDSGYGGLTILDGIRSRLPQYDYIYLGDNARAPYGTRSFDIVYEFTLQAVKKLFEMGCPLVILGCNTASAKALRSIQQNYLPQHAPDRRVLGVIIPTAEIVGDISRNHHIGVLVENGEFDKPGADYFVKDSIEKLMAKDPLIDTVILGCTHYPLLLDKIKNYIPAGVTVIPQGKYIAASLENYLFRHPEMQQRLSQGGTCHYYTTESTTKFRESASLFLHEQIEVQRVTL